MEPMRFALASVIARHDLLYGLLVSAAGQVLLECGDRALVTEDSGLLESLIGPRGDARTTFDSLEGQILPRIWGQGEVFAFLCKPRPDLLVIVFGRSNLPVADRYRLSKIVGAAVDELLG